MYFATSEGTGWDNSYQRFLSTIYELKFENESIYSPKVAREVNVYIPFPPLLALALAPALVASFYTPSFVFSSVESWVRGVGRVVDQGVERGVGRLHLVPLGKD